MSIQFGTAAIENDTQGIACSAPPVDAILVYDK